MPRFALSLSLYLSLFFFFPLRYGKVMCGFVENSRTSIYATQSDGCVELNGCSSWIIFPFLKLFTLIVTFVFLNLFVGIILDSFDEATDNACATVIDDDDFHRIWQHWKAYDPEETYCINIHNIKQFLQVSAARYEPLLPSIDISTLAYLLYPYASNNVHLG